MEVLFVLVWLCVYIFFLFVIIVLGWVIGCMKEDEGFVCGFKFVRVIGLIRGFGVG